MSYAFTLTNLVVKDTSYSDAESFKAAVAGVKAVFKTLSPTTIQLPPQQLDMLKGYNNVWSDTGDTSLVYVADTKMYIDSKISELVTLALAEN